MHSQDAAQAVTLLHEAAQTLSVTAGKLEALEQRMGMNAEPTTSPHNPHEERQRDPWLWISGANTKQYRFELREAGGRWSPKHQSWYFMNCTELPDHLANIPGTEIKVTY